MYVSNYKPNPKTGTVDDDDAQFVPDSVRVGAKHARHFGGQITPHSPVVAVAPLPPSRRRRAAPRALRTVDRFFMYSPHRLCIVTGSLYDAQPKQKCRASQSVCGIVC